MNKKILTLTIIFIIAAAVLYGQQKPNSASSMKTKPVPVANFKHVDIGNPSLKGIFKVSEGGYDITAGGADIWGTKDEFGYIYIERTGNFDISARIAGLTAANLYTKAGIMARENLTAGCRHIYFQVFSDNNARNKNNGGYEFQYRAIKDSLMKAIYPQSFSGTPEFPVAYPNTWIRLQRLNNDFTGYWSGDGKEWKVYTKYTLELPAKIYLGLAVTSHNTGHAATARFRNITEIIH